METYRCSKCGIDRKDADNGDTTAVCAVRPAIVHDWQMNDEQPRHTCRRCQAIQTPENAFSKCKGHIWCLLTDQMCKCSKCKIIRTEDNANGTCGDESWYPAHDWSSGVPDIMWGCAKCGIQFSSPADDPPAEQGEGHIHDWQPIEENKMLISVIPPLIPTRSSCEPVGLSLPSAF